MQQPSVLGFKASGYWEGNADLNGVPNHQSTIVLFNPETGDHPAFWRSII